CRHAKRVWVAGDDDQCIHEWNGAAPQQFIELEADSYTVLPQSYRIPAQVHQLAERIITQVRSRLPKEYKPREAEGAVRRVANMDMVDLSRGTWLLLARNLCFLNDFTTLCHRRGLLFTGNGFTGVDTKVLSAIKTWRETAG